MKRFLTAPLSILLFTNAAQAADNWVIEPSITQKASWESNPLLMTGGQKDLYGSITSPGLTFATHTPTTNLTAKASLDENIFNQSSFDSTDGHGDLKLDEQMERWGAAIALHSDYDTTRTSELTNLNNGVNKSVRHFGNTVSPEISFAPTEQDKILLDGSYLDSNYDSNVFQDYHVASLSPSYEYKVNPNNTTVLSLPAQRYETDSGIGTRTDSIAPTVGWKGILTPQVSAKANVGYERYTMPYTSSQPKDWKWTPVYSAEVDYKTESDLLNLNAKRDLQPYNDGNEAFLNTIALVDEHHINQLFTTDIGGSYQFSNDTNQARSLKSLIGANAGLTYHATQVVDVAASYQYREQELTQVQGNQTDNQFLLSFVYHPSLFAADEKK